jgi:hypothetical protein
MAKYRWTSETDLVRHDTGERITRGELFDPTDHERRQWPDRMVEVETCQAVIESGEREGEVCGRELPCHHHPDDGEE